MHQKNTAMTSSHSATIENVDDDDVREQNTELRNPFEDDAEDDVDSDDDGMGVDGGGAWGTGGGRGSWWRGALARRREEEKFGDGRDDNSDSDQEDRDDDDEEFGDFAMPEVSEKQSGEPANVIVKPLPVHPPTSGSKGGFTSLWPFGSKDKDKQQDKGKDKDTKSSADVDPEKVVHVEDLVDDDGKKIAAAHEAKARTSIEDPDEEEGDQVVVKI